MHLYVIAEQPLGPCKIGVANDPLARLQELQIGNHRRLVLYNRIKVEDHRYAERTAHSLARRNKQHLRGEWFAISVLEAVEIIKKAVDMSTRRPRRRLDSHSAAIFKAALDLVSR